MMSGPCRQAVLCVDSALMSSVSSCSCQLPAARRILCHSTTRNAVLRAYNGCLVNAGRYYSRYAQGLVTHRLQHTPPWKIMFFGTDEYALKHLKAMNENRYVNRNLSCHFVFTYTIELM